MLLRLCLIFFVTLALASCSNPEHKKKPKKPPEPSMKDASSDVSFQSFLGQLRVAVANHDVRMIASMMTSNFGYRLDPPGEGEGVFQYWDDKGVWPELKLVLRDSFVPKGNYMVSPKQFATDPNYHGYRAGIALVGGSWKFAYFVTD